MAKKRITPLSIEVDSRLYLQGKKRKDLAKTLGISEAYISLILSGEVRLTIDLSKRIAEEIGQDDMNLRRLALKTAI